MKPGRWVEKVRPKGAMCKGILRPKVSQELKEAHIAWQVGFAEASKDPQVRLEQREQALCAILVHVSPCVLFPRVIDARMHVALHRPIAAGRIGIQPTVRLHRQVGGLLHRLHGEIAGRVDDDRALAADPRDNGWAIFLVMAPAGLTLLAATTRSAPSRLWATLRGVALLAGTVLESIRCHRPLQPALGFVGHGRIPQPPAPARAGPALDPHLPGHASRRTRPAQQAGRPNPVRT